MSDFTPNQEQSYAINAKGDILVSAGAGSGKTAVLSQRVLHFIKDEHFSITDFLILTFTKLAAGEMKDRIRQLLQEEHLSDADYVDVADITTFDGYCNSLVKKYHNILDLEEGFTIVDSNVISVLKRKYIREELETLYKAKDPVLEELANIWLFKDDNSLEKLISDTIEKMNLSSDKKEFITTFKDRYYCQKKYDEMTDLIIYNIKQLLNELNKNIDLVPDLVTKEGFAYSEVISDRVADILSDNDYDSVIEKVRNFKFPSLPRGKLGILFDEEDRDNYGRFKDKFEPVSKIAKDCKTKEDMIKDIEHDYIYTSLVLKIAEKVDSRLMDYKFDHQAFEFADINKFAIKLVKENEDIREELKNKYKMIMIDEYQDTNEIQEDFISYIKNKNTYCVGDVKQAIYGFRNATPDLFMKKFDTYIPYPNASNKEPGTKITMDTNYRSRETVLNDINTIFSRIMTKQYGGADYKTSHMIKFGNDTYSIKKEEVKENLLDLYTYDTDDNYDVEKEIKIIASDIIHKINTGFIVNGKSLKKIDETTGKKYFVGTTRKCKFSDFAIIIDRGTQFEKYLKEFSKYKIPIYMEQDENLISNHFIQVLTNLITVIKQIDLFEEQTPKFNHAYVSLVRSFIYEAKENENKDQKIYKICTENKYFEDELYLKIKNIIYENKDASNYIKIEKVIEGLELYNTISRLGEVEKKEIYLDFFLNTYKQMQDLDYSYDEFISYLENLGEYGLKLNLSSKGSDTDAVKLINIHKSKGLEFGIIYFPGLNVKFPNFEKGSQMLISDEFGMLFRGKTSMVKKAYLISKKINDISERTRLLYVALTRAKEKMICIIPNSSKYKEKAEIQNSTFFDLIYPTLGYFKKYNKNDPIIEDIHYSNSSVDDKEFEYMDLDFNHTRKENLAHASKEITFDVNKEVLDLGTDLHFIMEVLDFKNPDYSFIKNPKFEKLAKAFLDSDLMNDVNKAKIYKEYEFVDQKNNTNGIIDLYLVYDDVVRIIDYKTSDLEHDEYKDQLKVYKDYLSQKYPGKKIETYLYSLMETYFKKIEIS